MTTLLLDGVATYIRRYNRCRLHSSSATARPLTMSVVRPEHHAMECQLNRHSNSGIR